MRFSGQEYWSGLPSLPPVDLLDPGIEPGSLMSPALAARFFTTIATWKAPEISGFLYRTKIVVMFLLLMCYAVLC